MDIQDVIRHALNGKAILFTGAGFSYGATNIEGNSIPTGQHLADDLLSKAGYSGASIGLDQASAAYLRKKTKHDLVELLISYFSVREVTESHKILASIPWRRVYSTNYDMVFEEASRRINKVCNSIDGTDIPQDNSTG